jgi:hypothetical protein
METKWTLEDVGAVVQRWLASHERETWTVRIGGQPPANMSRRGWLGLPPSFTKDEFENEIYEDMSWGILGALPWNNQVFLCNYEDEHDDGELRILTGFEAREA